MSRLIVFFVCSRAIRCVRYVLDGVFVANCVDSGGRGEGGARTRRGALIGSLLRMSPFTFLDCFDICWGDLILTRPLQMEITRYIFS